MIIRTGLLISLLITTIAFAQDVQRPGDLASTTDVTESPLAAQAVVAVPLGTLVTVPAFTRVYLRIDAELTSKKSKAGDRFPIHVDEDVRVGDAVVIPAGTVGEGEVIHVAKSGMGGKAGELLIAARFLRVGDQEVKLRSLSLGAAGRDRTGESLGTSFIVGPLALIVTGGVMAIPRDTISTAKTAVELQLPAVAPSGPPAAPRPVDKTMKEGGNDENKTT